MEAVRRRHRVGAAAGPWLLRASALVALVLSFASRVAADDEAWKARIEKELVRVEVAVEALDAQKPATGALHERVAALHARLAALEKAAGIDPGTIQGAKDLSTLTMDVAALSTRHKAILASRQPKPDTPPKPQPPAMSDEPPKKPAAKEWPKKVEFKVNSKVVYVETGHFVHEEYWDYVRGLYVVNDYFLTDGWQGKLSFSLRAAGLLRDVKGVLVRVTVRMMGPLTEETDLWRTYDVQWTASNAMGNDSLKTWDDYDTFQCSISPKHIGGPQKRSAKFDAQAWVVSATLKDGTEQKFEVPTFRTR